MYTFKLFIILLLALLVLGVLAFVFDSVKEKEIDDPNYPTRSYRIAKGCSFIVKFGMIMTACALVGSLSSAAGLGLAMAFAIPKPTKVQPSSWFDHSHNVATTMPFGAIVPIDWRFLQAGEKVRQNLSGFCRALQLKAPAMQDIDLKWGTFFVPLRLLNDNTEKIISAPTTAPYLDTGSRSLPYDVIGHNTDNPTFPYFNFDHQFLLNILTVIDDADGALSDLRPIARSFLTGGLMDYLGFPCERFSVVTSSDYTHRTLEGSVPISFLPLMAYHSICNHFFVDDCFKREDSLDVVTFSKDITGVIPWGDILDSADLESLFTLRYSQYESDPFTKSSTSSRVARVNKVSEFATDDSANVLDANKVRGMFALDEYARKIEYFFGDMRKQIKYMFGVVTSDRSAMSPILINAGSQPVQVSEINNTTLQSVGSEQTRQSAGKMLSSFGQHNKTFMAEEVGIYMTLAWIRPRTCYLNRLPIQFETWLDHFSIPNPLFAQIGDSTIKERSLNFNPFAKGTGSLNLANNFGYNSRYVLEKYSFDSFTGDFRDNLSYWHCARDFGNSHPTPNYLFRQINPFYANDDQSLNRIFSTISSVDGSRPFQLQFRFNTHIWQPYPHIDDEL